MINESIKKHMSKDFLYVLIKKHSCDDERISSMSYIFGTEKDALKEMDNDFRYDHFISAFIMRIKDGSILHAKNKI